MLAFSHSAALTLIVSLKSEEKLTGGFQQASPIFVNLPAKDNNFRFHPESLDLNLSSTVVGEPFTRMEILTETIEEEVVRAHAGGGFAGEAIDGRLSFQKSCNGSGSAKEKGMGETNRAIKKRDPNFYSVEKALTRKRNKSPRKTDYYIYKLNGGEGKAVMARLVRQITNPEEDRKERKKREIGEMGEPLPSPSSLKGKSREKKREFHSPPPPPPPPPLMLPPPPLPPFIEKICDAVDDGAKIPKSYGFDVDEIRNRMTDLVDFRRLHSCATTGSSIGTGPKGFWFRFFVIDDDSLLDGIFYLDAHFSDRTHLSPRKRALLLVVEGKKALPTIAQESSGLLANAPDGHRNSVKVSPWLATVFAIVSMLR
ncbi:hypothetical protein HYC85_029570 [Camellia sinensis]|uniref:Uncharacterized protein n=1 Tax=Camellia sinensis TaxID=4442 RepID=A0A7J7FYI2_CAMSI|nr:hypothetical protein HYC85_029570 [Camellia sinensis]